MPNLTSPRRFAGVLRQGTYVMHFANSVEGALDLIEPTLLTVLIPYEMPGMDGLQLCSARPISDSPPSRS